MPVLRLGVGSDEVPEAVVQGTGQDQRVERQRLVERGGRRVEGRASGIRALVAGRDLYEGRTAASVA